MNGVKISKRIVAGVDDRNLFSRFSVSNTGRANKNCLKMNRNVVCVPSLNDLYTIHLLTYLPLTLIILR